MDQGDFSVSTLNRYLRGTNFPASKEEASNAKGNGATQELVQQIKNANTESFDLIVLLLATLPTGAYAHP